MCIRDSLKAYASSEELNQACVENRFQYVSRESAPYVEWLGIQENPCLLYTSFRHEKTFVSKTRYAVSLCTCMSDEEVEAKLAEIPHVDYCLLYTSTHLDVYKRQHFRCYPWCCCYGWM